MQLETTRVGTLESQAQFKALLQFSLEQCSQQYVEETTYWMTFSDNDQLTLQVNITRP